MTLSDSRPRGTATSSPRRLSSTPFTAAVDPPHLCDLGIDHTDGMYGVYAVPAPEGGYILVDTGPSSGLRRLRHWLARRNLPLRDLRAVLLTHGHLDHAGGCGSLLRQHPVPVYCHPNLVEALIDPDQLRAGRDSLFRGNIDRMWGQVEAVSPERVHPCEDGASITVGGLYLRALHTPGHARSHIAWQWLNAPATERAGGRCAVFTGDIAGIRLPGTDYVWPSTPSPNFDFAAWLASLERLRKLQAGRLYLGHFGAVTDVEAHLDQLSARLHRWVGLAERVMVQSSSSGRLASELKLLDDSEVAAAGVSPETFATYDRNNPHRLNAAGLVRYLVQLESAEPVSQAG